MKLYAIYIQLSGGAESIDSVWESVDLAMEYFDVMNFDGKDACVRTLIVRDSAA